MSLFAIFALINLANSGVTLREDSKTEGDNAFNTEFVLANSAILGLQIGKTKQNKKERVNKINSLRI